MKIAFITTHELKTKASGVRKQAESWRVLLERSGHMVELVNPWFHYDWRSFDVLHVFGGGPWMPMWIDEALRMGLPIVHSPMLDVKRNKFVYKLLSAIPVLGHRLYTFPSVHRYNNRRASLCLVRNMDELRLVKDSLGVSAARIALVPVAIEPPSTSGRSVEIRPIIRGEYCLHVSQYTQDRKNVVRLAHACAKCGLPLVICGRPESEAKKNDLIRRFPANLTFKIFDFLESQELNWLYHNAKVFALPSLYEGAGLVSLEAASHGLEVVVSTRGGPRDYFDVHAHYANPESIDSIVSAINSAITNKLQPATRIHVLDNFSYDAVALRLVEAYKKVEKLRL